MLGMLLMLALAGPAYAGGHWDEDGQCDGWEHDEERCDHMCNVHCHPFCEDLCEGIEECLSWCDDGCASYCEDACASDEWSRARGDHDDDDHHGR